MAEEKQSGNDMINMRLSFEIHKLVEKKINSALGVRVGVFGKKDTLIVCPKRYESGRYESVSMSARLWFVLILKLIKSLMIIINIISIMIFPSLAFFTTGL